MFLRIRRTTWSWALTVLSCLLIGVPAHGQMELRIQLGKAEFFEGEPVYAVLTLTNQGSDTAWISEFDLAARDLRLKLTGPTGIPVPSSNFTVDYMPTPNWRGVPLPPGQSAYEAVVLQLLFGNQVDWRRNLYEHWLPVGNYQITATFRVTGHLPAATDQTVIEGVPVEFAIRPRVGVENTEYNSAEKLHEEVWDKSMHAGHMQRLLEWADSRLKQAPDDPFLPYMLSDGPHIAAGAGIAASPSERSKADALALSATSHLADRPGGAWLAVGIGRDHPEAIQKLEGTNAGTLGVAVARYSAQRLSRARH